MGMDAGIRQRAKGGNRGGRSISEQQKAGREKARRCLAPARVNGFTL